MDTQVNGTTIQTGDKIFNIGVINNANFGSATENRPFNEYLTKELLTSIRPYCTIANKFLDLVKSKPDWNQVADLSNKAKEIIAANYAGIIGIQLRKLMAIGKEPISENKQMKYIDNCLITAKRTIQLLCFTLISDLWNKKKEKEFAISEKGTEKLNALFEGWLELNILEYSKIIECLLTTYSENQLNFPIKELPALKEQLEATSQYSIAITELNKLSETPDLQKYTINNCDIAEKQLTVLLCNLCFFAGYKMVSIKNINYEEVRNDTPKYLYNCVSLGMDSKSNINAENLYYYEGPTCTDSVLIYKDNYNSGINLFPFIVDLSSLTFEYGVKICFFSCLNDMDENNFNYSFLEDNSIEQISYSGVLKDGSQLNDLINDKEKRKKFKLDTVFNQFREAKAKLISTIDLSSLDDL